jgi:hypothetical protein
MAQDCVLMVNPPIVGPRTENFVINDLSEVKDKDLIEEEMDPKDQRPPSNNK